MKLARILSRGRWLAHRMRGMTVAEIVERLGDVRRRRSWQRRPVGWPDLVGDGPMPDWPGLRQRLAATTDQPSVRASRKTLESGRLSFLGRDWPPVSFADADGTEFWLHDPTGKGRWPGAEMSCFAVDVRSTSDDPRAPGTFGDVKFVWEPNRLQVLHQLAAALAGGDALARTTALTVLHNWAQANPPYGGVNWVSGIEMALRLVGVALLCAASKPETWDPQDRIFLRRFVATHGEYLSAFPSRHSSANNHLIAEGLGLLVAGLLMPDHQPWADEGRNILEQEAARQILADGVGAEQSPTYQAFTMEMLAVAVLLCREAGQPLAPPVTARLVAGATFLRALMDDACHVPAIGDDDEGRVIGQPPDREPRYVASIVAAVAGLAGRPDLMPPDRDPHLRDGLFAVPSAGAPLAIGQQMFRQGGYTTSRDRIAGRTSRLVFDHGPLGYLSLCAHGHADALAIWLTIDDQPVFIDSGTYLYFAGGPRRTRLRQSPAHNTLSLGHVSQSIAAPGFSWTHRAAAGIACEDVGEAWSVTGWHDGYERRFGARHQRRITGTPSGYDIDDRLAGSDEPQPCQIRFLVPSDLKVGNDSQSVTISGRGGDLCRLVAPNGFVVSIEDSEFSPRFGELLPAWAIVLSGSAGAAAVTTGIKILEPGRPADDRANVDERT